MYWEEDEAGRTLLSAGTLDLGAQSNTDEAVVGLELLHGLGGVIDEGEASGLATTEVGAQTEDGDLFLLSLVQATELLAELLLGDVGTVGVQNVTVKRDIRSASRFRNLSFKEQFRAWNASPRPICFNLPFPVCAVPLEKCRRVENSTNLGGSTASTPHSRPFDLDEMFPLSS